MRSDRTEMQSPAIYDIDLYNFNNRWCFNIHNLGGKKMNYNNVLYAVLISLLGIGLLFFTTMLPTQFFDYREFLIIIVFLLFGVAGAISTS